MKYNPDKHHRHSIRLKGYDYAQPGAYFITICTQNRACLFGEIVDGKMMLNDAGKMVDSEWLILPGRFANVNLRGRVGYLRVPGSKAIRDGVKISDDMKNRHFPF